MTDRPFSKKGMALILVILAAGFSLLGIRQLINMREYGGIGEDVRRYVYAEITFADGVETLCLSDDKIFTLPHVPDVVFEVSGGQIAFVKSNCPDQICVRAGFQSRAGQMAACLHNNVILHILRTDESGNHLDVFTR